MSQQSEFHKLWVIESLPSNERKTGANLVSNELNAVNRKHPGFSLEYAQPQSVAEFMSTLQRIYSEAQAGCYPMLHIECHGSKAGLGMASGELLEWEDLRKSLISINQECRLNLVITLAACKGIYLIHTASKLDRAPFWGVIGPHEDMFDVDLERAYGAFYEEFVTTLSGDDAVKALNSSISSSSGDAFHFRSAEALFKRAYREYLEKNCTGDGLEYRISALEAKIQKESTMPDGGSSWMRQYLRDKLAPEAHRQHFEDKMKYFFFQDLFPTNAKRFQVDFDDVARGLIV